MNKECICSLGVSSVSDFSVFESPAAEVQDTRTLPPCQLTVSCSYSLMLTMKFLEPSIKMRFFSVPAQSP